MANTSKMTVEEIEEWDKLYQYVKKEILQYDTKKNIPNQFVLRLKGLREGKFMANKKVRPRASYTFTEILMTFKMCKFNILNSFSKTEFKNEGHQFNYMMTIIENNINDVVDKIERVNRAKLKGNNVEINLDDNKAEYIRKTKDINSDILNDLW